MKYDLSILLVLRKAQLDKKGYAPLYIRITVNGKRSELSVNRKVEPQKWDSRLQRMIGRSESARVLPICQKLPGWMDEGRSTTDATRPVKENWVK